MKFAPCETRENTRGDLSAICGRQGGGGEGKGGIRRMVFKLIFKTRGGGEEEGEAGYPRHQSARACVFFSLFPPFRFGKNGRAK